MSNEKDIHKNHRTRIKKKFRNNGLKAFEDHESLEFLLTFCIPRKDTNPIGHELLNTFGNLANVIDADYKDLQQVKGVGPEAALFINFISEFHKRLKVVESKNVNMVLNSTAMCVKYFRSNCEIKSKECLYIVCLRKNYSVANKFEVEGDEASIYFDTRDFAHNISNKGVHAVAVFHTHPGGDVKPSFNDIQATERVKAICKTIGITFVDHIIFNETSHYSFEHPTD